MLVGQRGRPGEYREAGDNTGDIPRSVSRRGGACGGPPAARDTQHGAAGGPDPGGGGRGGAAEFTVQTCPLMFLVTARGTPEDRVERVPWNLTRLTPA